ncbi:MAG: hypothetical protein WD598_02805 [Acidimicrobiia bacterium]
MRVRFASAVLSCVLAAAAVPASAGRGARDANACKLLKPREIAAVFDADVGRGRKGAVGASCLWMVAGGSGEGGGEIATLVSRGSSAREAFEIARSFSGPDAIAVDGLGREALYAGDVATLYVLESKRLLFTVQGVFVKPKGQVDAAGLQAKLVALAEIAAERV